MKSIKIRILSENCLLIVNNQVYSFDCMGIYELTPNGVENRKGKLLTSWLYEDGETLEDKFYKFMQDRMPWFSYEVYRADQKEFPSGNGETVETQKKSYKSLNEKKMHLHDCNYGRSVDKNDFNAKTDENKYRTPEIKGQMQIEFYEKLERGFRRAYKCEWIGRDKERKDD